MKSRIFSLTFIIITVATMVQANAKTTMTKAANDSLKRHILDSYVRYGERYIGCQWESPKATLFAEFKTNGNRTRYEQWTFGKRRQLAALVLAEKVEGRGRFMPDIVNGIMSTLEETWWGIPAHYGSKVMRPEDQNVDLFNAETAGMMAWTRHALKERIDSFSPLLTKRIDAEIERRMLIPALNTDYWWKRASMNWNPWICSNWLACVTFCEHDSIRRNEALTQIASAMKAFADGYPDDGGCDEGPTYWDRAAASLYECAGMMDSTSSGMMDSTLASIRQSLRKMAAYCYATYVADGYCLSFADSHGNRLVQQPNVMYPFAIYVDDPVMRRFAKYIAVEKGFLDDAARLYDQSGNYPTLGRELVFLSHLDDFLDEKAEEPHPADTWLHSLQIMTARRGSTFLGMKGGHNDESHNHNDVGNFVVYNAGKPLLIDPGVGEYTSKTFSKERYTIWTMQSGYHNLPQVNGHDQHEGKQFAARDVRYVKGRLTLDLASCYPAEAGIRRWQRTVGIDRRGIVTLTDDYDLSSVTVPVREMFISAVCPIVDASAGIISLGTRRLHYPKSKCSVAIEPLSDRLDPMLLSMWPDGLWRIVITVSNSNNHDRLTFEIK
ncbi:MAG: heparinase II/III family protein [Prevotella sp.]|nr:heparinase II/III family protein [Prevotella sp.]